jgi:hypothetical protein
VKLKPKDKPPCDEIAHFDAIHDRAVALLAAYRELIALRQLTTDSLAKCRARGDA